MKFVMSLIAAAIVASPAIAAPDGAALYKDKTLSLIHISEPTRPY